MIKYIKIKNNLLTAIVYEIDIVFVRRVQKKRLCLHFKPIPLMKSADILLLISG